MVWVAMKKCSKCHKHFPVTEFYKNKSRIDGLQKWCKNCCRQRDAARHRPYNAEAQKKYANKRAEYNRNRRAIPEVRAKLLAANKQHYLKNKEAYVARALARLSRTNKSAITHDDPKNVYAIYKKAAELRVSGYDVEVDHIVPLNGKFVSGLHVSWNLRIVDSAVNRSKSNKFEDGYAFT